MDIRDVVLAELRNTCLTVDIRGRYNHIQVTFVNHKKRLSTKDSAELQSGTGHLFTVRKEVIKSISMFH